jgi:hypothetical protein
MDDLADPLARARGMTRSPRLGLLTAFLCLVGLVVAQGVAAQSPSPDASAGPTASAGGSLAPPTSSPDAGASASELPSPAPSPEASAKPAEKNTCFACHSAIAPPQRAITEQWQASVHGQNGVGCADCHGGDPTSDEIGVSMDPVNGFIGNPTRSATVDLCGTCHSDVERMRQYQIPTDQLVKYEASVHGQRLLNDKDVRVAICIDCHGSHDVKKASDPSADVYPLNVPKLCSSCHSDPKKMQPYGIPTNQYELYQASVHGRAVLDQQDLRAPTCASCHGSHDAKPPKSTEVVQVCGKCHTATQALYEESKHARLAVGPKCWTCHGNHDVAQPDESRFFHPTDTTFECTTCHNLADRTLVLNADRFAKDADRRCDTCHHSASQIYAQAQGIHDTLDRANQAYLSAQARIKEAAAAGMIVTDADVQLTEARTSLIRARATVHTTKLTAVAELADAARAKAADAQAFADARLQESIFRRQAMVVVLGIILINVVLLYLLKRRITRGREVT